MHRWFILLPLVLSAVGVVVGESLRGTPGSGVLYGALVLAAAWDWSRQRMHGENIRDVADRLAVYIMLLALALASGPLDVLEDWVSGR